MQRCPEKIFENKKISSQKYLKTTVSKGRKATKLSIELQNALSPLLLLKIQGFPVRSFS